MRLANVALALAVVACSENASSPQPPAPVDAEADRSPSAEAGTTAPDAGAPSRYNGAPIEAEAGKWTFVSFPDSACGNGSPAGFGINPGTSGTLFVYLEGGGACWDEQSCFTSPSAARTTVGVSAADLENLTKYEALDWPFNRKQADNPFKDASWVYVPYCTGDFHAGATVKTYGSKTMHHNGRKNVEAFLQRLVPTFSKATRVVFSGSSAGGFGAYLNFWRVQDAFAPTRVDLIDDAGQPLRNEFVKRYATWSASWDLPGNFPPACVGCADSFDAVLPWYLATYPSSRIGLISYVRDFAIPPFFDIDKDTFASGLQQLVAQRFTGNAKYFLLAGEGHGTLDGIGRTSGNNNTKTISSWLADMQSATASWENVTPP